MSRAIAPPNTIGGAVMRIAASLKPDKLPLLEFVKQAWPILEPAQPFVDNWHIGYLCEHLEAVDAGQIQRLLATVPPRTGKSIIFSVIWPAWSWTWSPWLQWVFASYSASLSTKFSVDRRQLIQSSWYRSKWGAKFSLTWDQNQKTEFQNNRRGFMVSTSVGGTITGKGGERIVIDDLLNPLDAESKAARQSSNDFYSKTLVTRLNNPKSGAIVCVMQRLHAQDLAGQLIAEGGWTQVKIPSKAEQRETIIFPMSKAVKIREEGEHLCEARAGEKEFLKQRAAMGSRAHDAQAQQKPSVEVGNLFKRDWWKYYKELPSEITSGWFWDTAVKEEERNDRSCGIRMALCEKGVYLTHFVGMRVEYPQLKRAIQAQFDARNADLVEVEDKSSGQQILQDLGQSTRLPLVAFEPGKRDKYARASRIAPHVEAGRVYLPEGAPWVADFVEALAAFPEVEHDDEVDALVMGLMRFLTAPEPAMHIIGEDAGHADLDDDDDEEDQ